MPITIHAYRRAFCLSNAESDFTAQDGDTCLGDATIILDGNCTVRSFGSGYPAIKLTRFNYIPILFAGGHFFSLRLSWNSDGASKQSENMTAISTVRWLPNSSISVRSGSG